MDVRGSLRSGCPLGLLKSSLLVEPLRCGKKRSSVFVVNCGESQAFLQFEWDYHATSSAFRARHCVFFDVKTWRVCGQSCGGRWTRDGGWNDSRDPLLTSGLCYGRTCRLKCSLKRIGRASGRSINSSETSSVSRRELEGAV
jgi:hypothetical protein